MCIALGYSLYKKNQKAKANPEATNDAAAAGHYTDRNGHQHPKPSAQGPHPAHSSAPAYQMEERSASLPEAASVKHQVGA